MSSRPLKLLLALAATAAAAAACAEGRASRQDAPQAAQTATAATPVPPSTAAASPQAERPAQRFPARERAADAFEPYIVLSGARRFESRSVERKPARKDLKVSADYPVLSGDERPAAREFNRRARAFVLDDVTPYLEDTPDPEKEKNPLWKDVEEFHNVSHTVVYASDELVSVLFYVEGYNWGAAHGFHQPVTFNFDLKAGREIKLAQLFKPGSDYLRRIARLCAEDLARQREAGHIHGGGYSRPEDLKPTADSFDAWVVTPAGLVLIFEEYEVAPYASGEPKVLVRFDSLRDIINPRGALARFAATSRT